MHWIVTLVLFAAGDVLGPADYVKILADSKLHYVVSMSPSKTPVEPMNCDRRDEQTRLVVEKNGKRRLVEWKVAPEATKLFNEGEALFQKDDYDGAAEKYKAGLAADPQAIAGYFFLGDALLFGRKDPAAALKQYRKGIALDPTMPSGHFFAQTALVLLGRNDEAREEVIKALTYHPAYESLWKAAAASEERWKIKPIVRHKFEPPAGIIGGKGNTVDVDLGEHGEWAGYAICKAAWANEPRFRKQHVAAGWSLDEERACVLNQLMGAYNAANEKVAAMPPLEQHLWDVAQAKLLDGYILFEIMGQHCPMAMSTLDDEATRQLDAYIRKYVIVARQ